MFPGAPFLIILAAIAVFDLTVHWMMRGCPLSPFSRKRVD